MKIAVAILSFIGIFGLSSGQESAPTNQAIAPFRRLVTLLQSEARAAAKRQTKI